MCKLTNEQFEKLMMLQQYLPHDDKPVANAKHLLVEGFDPEFVAEYTGLKLEKVKQLYEESWNPRCRIPLTKKKCQVDWDKRQKEMYRRWKLGFTLQQIAKDMQVSVFHVWQLLKPIVPQNELDTRLPDRGTRDYNGFIFLYRRHKPCKRSISA
ncbi:hypothetical protein IWC83_004868 [Escherichia coli]|nr:hypothetical protein [Escherichia coli]